jgi:hypothetical protein
MEQVLHYGSTEMDPWSPYFAQRINYTMQHGAGVVVPAKNQRYGKDNNEKMTWKRERETNKKS